MPDKPTGDNDPAAGGGDGGKTVPIHVVESLKDELKEVKQEIELHKDQIRLYQANQGVQSQGGKLDEGENDDNVVTLGEVKKLMAGQESKIGGLIQGLEVKTDNPDFTSTVNKYIPILVKERPDLAQAIKNSGNPALLAFELCKSLPQYKKDLAEAELKATGKEGEGDKEDEELTPEARRIIENQGKPGAPSGAAGGGGGQNTAEYYGSMSDDDLEKKIQETIAKEGS